MSIPSPTPLQWRILTEPEWRKLREVRLAALKDSPASFLSTYASEVTYDETRWREEFCRGEWIVATTDKSIDGLVGVTRGSDIGPDDRYIEYLWISPRWRRARLATNLIRATLERLTSTGIATVWLWILDGNEPAKELYNKCGFTSTGERQHPEADPNRIEERMQLRLKLSASQLAEHQDFWRMRSIIVYPDPEHAFERGPLPIDYLTCEKCYRVPQASPRRRFIGSPNT